MFASTALEVLFTITFLFTGAYALVRLALLFSGTGTADRLAELSHLTMSVAMLAMTWSLSGNPATASGIVQLALFGLLTVWFAVRAVTSSGHDLVGNAYHAIMSAAMVWMVATMPLLMPMATAPSGSGGEHAQHGHGGHTGSGTASHPDMHAASGSDAPVAVVIVTGLLIAVLTASAVWWAIRALHRQHDHAGGARPATSAGGLAHLVGPRVDEGCHLLMSLGMGGMLLAMW